MWKALEAVIISNGNKKEAVIISNGNKKEAVIISNRNKKEVVIISNGNKKEAVIISNAEINLKTIIYNNYMNSDPTSVEPTVEETVDIFPANHTNQWPIIKDMWSFFAGNAGNINILSILANPDVVVDLKLAEKVGAKMTVCVPSNDAIDYWTDVKIVLKERGKSSILNKNEVLPVVAKCWVLANRITVVKGLPSIYNGTIDIPTLSDNTSDLSGNTSDLSGNALDLSGNTTTIPLISLSSLIIGGYYDIVKVDYPGQERFVLFNIIDAGMRPAIVLVRWSKNPDKDNITRSAAATFQNHGYVLLSKIDDKYLYYYNDKAFYTLCSWNTPSFKNPMIEKVVSLTKGILKKNAEAAATAAVSTPISEQPPTVSE